MSQTVAVDRIELIPSGFFTVHYSFRSSAGMLGVLTVPAFRRDSTFRDASGQEWRMRQSRFGRREYEMRTEEVVATARPQGFWRAPLDVLFQGQTYSLKPTGRWENRWRLLGPTGEVLVATRRRGILRSGLVLEIMEPIPLALVVFTCYLILTRERERGAAASAYW
ncbi:MAG: hypothetical protein ACUVXE_11155 [Anaerolineae bacterium]